MNAELNNIEAAESLLKFVIARLNNPPENQHEEYQNQYIKQQAMAIYLHTLILNQTTHCKNKSKKMKKNAIITENRVNVLINTLKNQQLKLNILAKKLPASIAVGIPKLPEKQNKHENKALIQQLLSYSIQPLFTPAYNQIWFEMISSIIEKYQPDQQSLKHTLTNATNLNEIHRVAKANFKAEQKLNSLAEMLHKTSSTDKNFSIIREDINRYIDQILHEQLPKEIHEILSATNTNNVTKLSQIYLKIYPDNGADDNCIKDGSLRNSAFKIAEPFMKKMEEELLANLEKANTLPYELILQINSLLVNAIGASSEFKNILTHKKNMISQQIVMAMNALIENDQMSIYHKIENINTLLGSNFSGLSPQITEALSVAKNALRKNINQEITAIFNNKSFSSSDKLKRLLVISNLMAKGSVLHQSFIATTNAYMKILINNEIIQFSPCPERSTLQQLETLNDLTMRAQQLNILNKENAEHIKKHNNILLWKIACEINYLSKQNFVSEQSIVIPAEIKNFKLPSDIFATSQRSTDAVTKTFVHYILSANNNDEACLKMEQAIVIANHLLHKGSMDNFLAILMALNNGAITRLKIAMNGLSPQARKLLEEFNIITDAKRNFPALRQVQQAALQSDINLVPSLTLLSKDLTSAAENPAQSQEVIIKLVGQFNTFKEKIANTLTRKSGKLFQASKSFDEATAYQFSEKLEPRNVQGQSTTIISTLSTLIVPHKKNVFDVHIQKIVHDVPSATTAQMNTPSVKSSEPNKSQHNSAGTPAPLANSSSAINCNKIQASKQHSSVQSNVITITHSDAHQIKGKANSSTVTKKSGSEILFERANYILRSSSSYIASVISSASDDIKNIVLTNEIAIAPAKKAILNNNVPANKVHLASKQKKHAKEEKNQVTDVIKTLNNFWQGFLSFFSLDLKPNPRQNTHRHHNHHIKKQAPQNSSKPKDQTKSADEYTIWLQTKKAEGINKSSGSYISRIFPANRNGSGIRQQQALSSHSANLATSRSFIMRG